MVAAPWPEWFGSQEPRIKVVPEGEDHPRWEEIKGFIAHTKTALDPWQQDILRIGFMRQERSDPLTVDGVTYTHQWAAFVVGTCAPRQNGKNGILEMRELIGACLLGEKLVIHSAHLADTSKEGFRRLDDILDANEWLSKDVRHIWRTNGHEAIEFRNGNRIRFRTRTRGGGRGFSGSPVVFDEAMFLPEVSHAAILPVISAQSDPQLWYMGSAVDQTTMEDGVVFTRVRERALSGESERLAYFEWSLDLETPDLVEPGFDLERLAFTNPALGIRITPDYLKAEYDELDDRAHAVERYGVGDWPPIDGSGVQVIPIEKWDALADDPAAPGARMLDPVNLAFAVSPDRAYSAILAAGRRADADRMLEVVDHRPGTGWIGERLVELAECHEPRSICCDEFGPAGSLIHECEDLGLKIDTLNSTEYGKAFSHFIDSVEDKTVRHLNNATMRNAIRGAIRRPIGDGVWGWGRRNSTVDITTLEAGTIALWAFHTTDWDGEVVIW